MTAGKSGFFYGYLIVASCIAFCIGPSALAFSCAGIFYTPVSESLGVSRGVFAIYMTVLCLSMTIALPFIGRLMEKKDMRVILSIAVAFVGCGIMSMSFFNEVWQFYIAGAFIGIGEAALLYLATPTLVNRWFSQRNGFFIGLCMAFTGIGGVIFNMVGGWLIADFGWRTGYLVFGILALVIALPFALFVVRSRPSDKGLLPYGADAAGKREDKAAPAATGVSASVAMKSPVFYALALLAGLIGFDTVIYQFLPSYASSLAPSFPEVAAIAATLASAAMLGQAVGKVTLGAVNDKSVFGGLSFGVGCGVVGMVLMLVFPSQVALMLVGGFAFGVFYATATVQVPLMTSASFGTREYSSIYSRISMVSSLAAAFAATIWGFLSEAIGFEMVFVIGIALAVLVWLLGVYVLRGSKKLVHTTE